MFITADYAECLADVQERACGLSPDRGSADERRRQRESVRRWAARQSRHTKLPVTAMIRAYEEATGTYVCCD